MRRGNRAGLLVLVPLNIAAWLLGSMAVYYFNLYLFSVTFIINACLAAAIFSFHTLGNLKVVQAHAAEMFNYAFFKIQLLLSKLWQKITGKVKQNEDDSPSARPDHIYSASREPSKSILRPPRVVS